MSKTKGGGSTRNGRDSNAQRLGVKVFGGTQITAGYLFDVPARFDSDKLEINLSGFSHGAIPRIPIVEVRE